ncbi:WxL protein peptidoglycan domain-containing protein [Amycolatopsis eburnea]|uniref:DUF916 domain-containing protein n=1 Tax=Amycolatopsis eburnea TaxID=2267691 RepID=A0A427T199_9PSEU|nr:DUF916 domain-containing protein [Amycolatopsis eburnea]RSD11748.1 DUF916 domain-containing protein [Amycolatopsis eburnea]
MHPLARAVVSLLAAAAFAAVTAGPAAAQAEAPWTVATAANDFGADRDNYSYTAEPGQRIDDGLVIANHGAAPLDLAVYAADAFTTGSGRLDLLAKDKPSTGVGAWVRPGQDHVTVQPGQTTEVPFTVTVPAGATAGDHLGGILASVVQGGVERRVGTRIRVRVGGDPRPGLSVENLDVDYSGTANPLGSGNATLTYTIRNTGNAILAARQSASLSGPFGTWRVQADAVADSPQLLPGETWQVSVPVHGVTPAVYLAATVTLLPLLTDAAGSTAPLAAADTTAHSWAIPWTVVLLAALVAGTIVVLRRRRGRHGENEQLPERDEVGVQPDGRSH